MTINEFRQKRKKAGVCRDCGKVDAYTMGGRTYCFECAQKGAERKRLARQNPEKRERMLEQHRQMQLRYEQEHKCKQCGKPLPEDYKFKRCVACRAEQARAVKRSRENRYGIIPDRREEGQCFMCNKQPAMEGKRMCKACYEQRLPIAIANLEKTRGKNHPWRTYKLNLKAE